MKQRRMTAKEYREKFGGRGRHKNSRASEESNHQITLFEILELNLREFPFLKFIYAVPNGGLRHPKVAAQLKREGVKRGVPDICIPMARRGYGGAYIKNKYGKNKMSREQIKFRDHLISENYCFKNCYRVEEQIAFVEWYLNIELKRK